MKRTFKNETEVKEFGAELASKLPAGSVLALVGDLGVGKTTLTKAIAKGLGITEHVKSPTFNIISVHPNGRLPLYHFDVYRLDSAEEMEEIGYEDYFYGDGICVVEWADKIEEVLPEGTIFIRMEYGQNEGERNYDIVGY